MAEIVYQSERATIIHGDAADALELVAEKVDMIATDPPYGVKWQSGRRASKFAKLAGDDGSLDVPALLGVYTTVLRARRHVYVFGYTTEQLSGPMRLGGTTDLVWDKELIGPGDLTSPWAPQHERLTFGVLTPSAANRASGDGRLAARLRQGSVLRFPRPNSRGVKRHPTEKPVPLMRQLVESSSTVGETVLDPFAGSGSTGVAAVLEGRKFIGVELDATYAATTVERIKAAEKVADAAEAL
ncbi:DNA methyltransferase [Streptomyces sp. ITFR-6]|uniref:DNA-methyltransferase n=1 Tax=Streptomyces sp. ITFR-6 TaxID=3075197 RepID=UPI00288BF111|nr:DNA methyltransferase [Streptomyces sp. ITFR-6]WNI28641.1 DNA methyltransferase [Streptomyces sp. ITFR-6]